MVNLSVDVDLPSEAMVLARLQSLERSYQRDLDEAQMIQQVMLPIEELQAGPVVVQHKFKPVNEVGGDFLDYYALPDGTIGLYVGDVCGKGLPAAMYAALTVGSLRGVHKTGQEPATVLAALNRRMTLRQVTNRYAALQYAVFDPVSGIMRIASAGMCGPFHVSPGGCQALELSGIPPGIFSSAAYATHTLQLLPGDSVVFCTDGLLEAMNPEDEMFGLERIIDLYSSGAECVSGLELAERLFAAVDIFTEGRRQHDDMAVAVLHYAGPSGG
jgi:sigma-B regulation protein RsbU (phosphoserine phosphatase)